MYITFKSQKEFRKYKSISTKKPQSNIKGHMKNGKLIQNLRMFFYFVISASFFYIAPF